MRQTIFNDLNQMRSSHINESMIKLTDQLEIFSIACKDKVTPI